MNASWHANSRVRDGRSVKKLDDLTATRATIPIQIKRKVGEKWCACRLNKALRAVLSHDATATDASDLLSRRCSWAQRSGLQPFITLGGAIRQHRKGLLVAIGLGINKGRIEDLSNRVRLIVRYPVRFHTATATLVLVLLPCGPIELHLRHQRTPFIHIHDHAIRNSDGAEPITSP